MDGTLSQLAVVLASVVGLGVGARLLVDAVVRLARRFGLSELVIGLTVVAAGTSTPELAVSLDAAFKGLETIAVANVLGSNVYNLAFVMGVVALIRVIPIDRSLLHRDGIALLAGTAAGGGLLLDLALTRPEGVAMTGLSVLYTLYLLQSGRDGQAEADPDAVTRAVTERVSFRGRDAVLLVGGLALVLVSGDLMVRAASNLARGAGVSEWVIGGTVVAAGTSTPELAVSLVAVRRGSLGVSVGNLVGSNLFNLLVVLGLAATINPLSVSAAALSTLAWLAAITVLVVAALWTGRKLSRVEGGLLAGSEVVRWVLGLLS
ncbi:MULTISPECIES: calcium/sodium antiporter [Halolamina]|uniref:Cation:H+ antiporter n=1 Tax=Halolamina pelagica TaxID=699431 RepID=A0A1I5P5M3_9EURY|nr:MULTISPECIES: calcium/sodium antiporter [Halolamina]NHX36617.1 calcium/sodium antiporter [Halolamina sp. R1-12]SFP28786.1 cation:H+ antiporter [Halolamina pelagica]